MGKSEKPMDDKNKNQVRAKKILDRHFQGRHFTGR
jgi:hypothetical protein